ncbi:nuclear pore complex protein Nup153-like isoform X2 [Saccostrea cucullata]|uniref:nuclear pore complex protein Nup153-like isoform X2 n=1 Tax=Saccostrea cuccullata TaxID=36930 RepID=UPI002ED3F91A
MSTPLNDARKIPFEDTVLFDSQTPVAPRGPPRRQLTTPLAASVTKNRQRIRLKETEPAKCQEELPTETKSNSYSAGGKLKEKKFSQHISKRGNFYDEEAELPNLRTEFTLPVDNITGMKFGILDKENGNKDKGQRNATDGVFTFSSPVQKGEILNTTSPVPKMNFTFSSPIKVNSPQTAVSQPIKSVGEVKATAEHVFQPSTLKPHTGRTEVPDREVKRKLPVKTWDCDVCLVPNKMENAKCLACESPRSGSQPSTSGFMVKPKSFSLQTGFVGDSNGPANPGVNESSLNGDGIKKPAAVEKPLGKLEKDASPFGQTLNLDRKSKSSVEENSGFKIEKTSESTILKSSGIIVKENESPRKRATLPEKTEQKAVNFTIPASMTTIPNVPVTKESGESNKVAGTFTSPFLSNSTDSATPAPVQFNKMSPIFGASISTMNKGQTEKNQDSKVLASAPSFPVVQNTTTNSTVTFQFGVNSMKTTSVTSPNFQFGQSTAPNSEEKIQFSVNSSKASSATPSFQFGQSNSEAPKSNASIQFGQSNSEAPKSNASFQFRQSNSEAPKSNASFQFGQSNSEAPKSNASFQFGQSNSEAPKSNASFQFGQSNSIAPKSNAPFQFGANSTVTSSATLSSSFQFSASATSGTSMSAKTVPLQAAAASLPKAVSSPGSMFSVSGFNSGSLGNTTVPGSQGESSINSNFGFAGQAPTFGTSASFEKEKPAGFNFSFGASKPSGAESNSLFQFGNQQQPSRTNENQPTLNGGLNPAPQGLFSFSAAPQPTPPQPSLPAATSFNAGPANPPTAGSPFFNIGASNDSGRRVKKAVRKLKR